MNGQQVAGLRHAGVHCHRCGLEVASSDVVEVSEDGDCTDGDGGFDDLTTVRHFPTCPEAEA